MIGAPQLTRASLTDLACRASVPAERAGLLFMALAGDSGVVTRESLSLALGASLEELGIAATEEDLARLVGSLPADGIASAASLQEQVGPGLLKVFAV
jgi:hypothetical protein